MDEVVIILRQLARQVANLEIPWAGRADGGHFGGASGEEELLETFQFLGPDRALDHFDPAPPREVDDGPPRDPVEKAVGRRRMQRAIANEKGVGPGRLGRALELRGRRFVAPIGERL